VHTPLAAVQRRKAATTAVLHAPMPVPPAK